MNTAFTLLPPTRKSPASTARVSRLARAGKAVWRTLEAVGQVRAQHELSQLADRYELTQPALAQQLRAASRQGPLV